MPDFGGQRAFIVSFHPDAVDRRLSPARAPMGGKYMQCNQRDTAYWRLGALNSLGEAVLYSVDSISTRGASGLVLEHHWRMMGALEATDGMLLFGISTAYIFTVMQDQFRLIRPPH